MNRRRFLASASIRLASGGVLAATMSGCKGHQYARVIKPGETEMVGSHHAGGETFKPLIDEAVARLLERNCQPVVAEAGYEELPPPRKRICFVGVENRSIEEMSDFKDQIYQIIDTRISESQVFELVSQRFVQAGLTRTRLRPEDLFVPDNMHVFTAEMEQAGQPFDYMLWATISSGTTRQNDDYQRDYLLTLEMVDVRTGQFDKDSASLSKGYHHTRVSRWNKFNLFK